MLPRLFLTTHIVVAAVTSLAAQAPSGPVTPPYVSIESRVDSGYLANASGTAKVVFRHRFFLKDTGWLQFRFGETTNLPAGSILRMTAVKDRGVYQRHDGLTLAEWGMNSASFNGDTVLLELIAGPNTKGNHVRVVLVRRGLLTSRPPRETICGPRDDRVKSLDRRQGRLWLGCSGWLAGPIANGTRDLMITAGHCTGAVNILELNVPNSTAGGSVRRSAPNDQYPYTVLARLSSGVGRDWQVASVGKNSNTGRTPTQANGGTWYKLGAVPTSTSGQNITITGYGTTSPRNFLSQVQKIHTGPLSRVASTSLCYATDTSGGNSGSPVIHANTGNVIGIHTHGGCTSTGGCNSGTRIDRSDLQNAIKAAGKRVGEFNAFGIGCKGTGQSPSTCSSNNPNGGTLSNSRAPNEYAYIASTASSLRVTGFEIFSRSTAGNVTVRTAIYGSTINGAPTATPLATGTMTIGTTAKFYKTTLSATIPAGRFFVSVDHSAQTTYLATISSGTAGRAYWRRPPFSGNWLASGIVINSSFRVLCAGGGSNNAVPVMGSRGLPSIGASFDVTIAQGKASASAVLLSGLSKTTWAGGTLPFSLAPLGAAGCNLFVDPLLPFGASLDSSGAGSLRFTIPNTPSLVGVKVHHQWYVIDAGANTLGVAVTGGATSVIGG